MPLLFDVSKVITVLQRLCQFAEEFTEEYRESLVEALTELFGEDLEEGEEALNVSVMIRSLVRRLRRTLNKLTRSETELIVAVKDNSDFTRLHQETNREMRTEFDRARTETRNHFGRAKADSAGFPARIAVNSSAVMRQTDVVSLIMRKPDFELGESLVANSPTTVDSVLGLFEPKVEELRKGQANAVRRRARIQGKQVAKNKEMRDFRTTYSLFVNMVRSAFRLAGQDELAKRLTLSQPSRSTTETKVSPLDPPEGTPTKATASDAATSDTTPPETAG